MCARRTITLWICGGLLVAAAGCGSDRPGEVGSARSALGRSANLTVHSPGALAAQSDASIAANADASILVTAYTDPRGALTSPVSLSGIARSADGGRSFVEVLGPNGETTLPSAAGGEVLGRPRVAYDPRRDRFVVASSYVRPGDQLQGVCLHVSGLGDLAGTSWSDPVEVTPSFVAGERAEQASLDINAATGRLSLTWVQHGGAAPRLMYSHSDDLGQTWSAAAVLAQAPAGGWVDGPSPRVLPGTSDGDSVVYAVWRSIESGTALRNVGCRRSTDGGATWEPTVHLDAAGYPPEDQIPGVDEARSSPAIDIDESTGDVYVVYQRSAADGTGEIALRRLSGPCAPGDAVLLNSNPGDDRAQFFPVVTVDRSTGTVHVVYYDQDFAASGDMTEVMHTASSDHGVTWTPPTPISDRPFRAGYGNDTSRRNLGELLGGVAAFGELYSVFSATSAAPRFDEGQPASASMSAPDVAFDVLDEFARVAPLRVARVRVSDAACGALANERADPGELVELGVYLENYVGNPVSGRATVSGITATLSSETPLVRVEQANATYPQIEPLRVVVNNAPFRIKIARELVAGTPIDLTLTVNSDQGTIDLPVRIETGVPGTAEELLREDFDAASAPDLPAGWRSVREHGASGSPWIVSQTLTPGDNAAFHDESEDASLVSLLSPPVTIPASSGESHVTLEFDLWYDLEDDPLRLVQAYDGLTLRIEDLTPGATPRAVLAEAFAEQILTGASLHFPKRLPATDGPAAAQDQSVWSGSSRGKKRVSIRFPAAGMHDRTVQLRFDYIQDDTRVCTDVGRPGPCGVAIDNIVLAHVPLEPESCGADLAISQTDQPDPVAPGEQLTYTLTVRNDGPRDASDLVVTNTLPEGTTLVGAAGTDWTCTQAEEGLVCRRASLAAQESSTIAVTVDPPTVAGERHVDIKNVVEVRAAEHDPDDSNNSSEESTVVSMPVLLIGYLTVDSSRVAGDEVTYTLSLTNTGGRSQGDNLDLEFLDVLPPELQLRGADATHGAVISDFAANSVGWNGHLDPGEWMILSIDATIRPFTEGLVISNQGTIFYDADSDGVNEASVLTDDPLLGGAADPTVFEVRPAICGDGVLGRGEGCDDGNLLDGDCCSARCTPEPTTVLCRISNSTCDPPEYCDGAGHCPSDFVLPDGFPCLDADVCNGFEFCLHGVCMFGIPLDCDDGDPRTADECHPRFGCRNIPSDIGGDGAGGAGSGVPASGAGGAGDGAGGDVRTGGGGDMTTGGGGDSGAGAGVSASGAGGDGGAGAGVSASGAGGDGGAGAGVSASGAGGDGGGGAGVPASGAGGDGGAGGAGAGVSASGAGGDGGDGGAGAGVSASGAGGDCGAGAGVSASGAGGDDGAGGDGAGRGDPPAPCCYVCFSCDVSGTAGGQAPCGARPLPLAGLLSLLGAGLVRWRRHGATGAARARSSRRVAHL